MNYPNYRILNENDLIKISQKRNNFVKCKGNIFCLLNTKQALIITYDEISKKLKRHFEKRHAQLIAELNKNKKTFLLLNCENLASIKALCRRQEIKAPRKIKSILRLNDLIIDKAQ